jgi:hypothetical protein
MGRHDGGKSGVRRRLVKYRRERLCLAVVISALRKVLSTIFSACVPLSFSASVLRLSRNEGSKRVWWTHCTDSRTTRSVRDERELKGRKREKKRGWES